LNVTPNSVPCVIAMSFVFNAPQFVPLFQFSVFKWTRLSFPVFRTRNWS